MGDQVTRVQAHVVEVTSKTRWVFVQLHTQAGLVGLGEGSLNNQEGAVLRELRSLAPALFALPHAEPGPLPAPRGLPEAAAVSAVDQALWDLAARRTGVSVASALGGERRTDIPLYANINRRTRDRGPDGFAASARDALAAGYDAVKIAPFDEVAPEGARVPGAIAGGLERIAATREAIGPDRDLLVDCHWRLDQGEARDVLRETAPFRLHWLECPLPETDANLPALRRLRGLANAQGVKLAGCEHAIGLDGFEPFLHAGIYDAMMPDAKYMGGLSAMLRLAERFQAAGVAFSPHNPTGPVCHAASLQVCAAAAGLDRLEVQFDETSRFGDLVDNALPPVRSGVSSLPPGQGLGVRFAPQVLRELRVDGLDLVSSGP